jgi:protein-L-isoaspartate(D-aspartate) O-methyltransferase
MVEQQIVRRGVRDEGVLRAMRAVPRHHFVDKKYRRESYSDGPLPIGRDQTISQPYIVASMTEELELKPTDRVLEIGTGCGYQTAVLAEMAAEVYSIERIAELLEYARGRLDRLGYSNIHIKVGDGFAGWEDAAPFDAIILTAAAASLPERLMSQLRVGGRMVLPVATGRGQELVKLVREDGGFREQYLYPVRFVPMLGDTE